MDEKQFKDINEVNPPHEPTVLALADIARQLTRIADQGDETAKARDHSVEQMMSALTATEAPDANELVEAVKKRVGDFDMLSAGQVFKILDDVMAAHEKAVR